ncbi:MAG: dihydrodipicolinate synthase family protein [Caldilineaceae bacterium]|jgi:N-acetylneuraminate lyase
MMQKFSGAWPAMITPFTPENEVDIGAINALVDYLLDKQADGFYLCGSTGQGIYQSVAERKLTAETALRRIDGRVPAIVHVGSQSLPDAIDLALHAQRAGASGVSSIIPAGYADLASVSRYYAAVAGAVPSLPFLPYLFTSTSSAVALMESIADIPNLAGAKYTGPNMYELREIIEAREEPWSIFSGMDEQCVFGAMVGSCGNIGSTLNVMPGIYRQIHKYVAAGNAMGARDLQLRANRVTKTLFAFDFMAALYEAMSILGVDAGGPRLPSLPFDENRRGELREALAAVDFLEIATM